MTEVVSLEEASSYVGSGMTVGIGGVQAMFPMAIIRELVRRNVKNLTIVGPMSGMAADVLIAAGAVRRVLAPYMGAGGRIPSAPAHRYRAERGDIEIFEVDTGILGAGLRAAGLNIPFFPWLGGIETSMTGSLPGIYEATDPQSGGRYVAVPPLQLDVALIHCWQADSKGNCQYLAQTSFSDALFSRAANVTVASAERLVSADTVMGCPERTGVSEADVVTVAPWGAHPYSCPGVYRQDEEAIVDYAESIRDAVASEQDPSEALAVRQVAELKDHFDYIANCGLDRLIGLEPG